MLGIYTSMSLNNYACHVMTCMSQDIERCPKESVACHGCSWGTPLARQMLFQSFGMIWASFYVICMHDDVISGTLQLKVWCLEAPSLDAGEC